MKIPKIYLDNCCYNRPFDEQSQDLIRLETEAKLVIQARVRSGIYPLVWSFILDSENDDNPTINNREAIGYWRYIADEYCAASHDILSHAKYFLRFDIKHKDALHLACAINHGCDYLITTDKKFLNKNDKVAEIKIINPITFVFEMDGEQ